MMKSSPPDPLMLPSMSLESHTLKPYLEEQRQRVEARLRLLVPEENETPQAIHRAVRYSLFAGGKRIRPIFCLEAASTRFTRELLEYFHRSKPAALFRAAVCMGAIGARADELELRALCIFGENAGLAFQIADDILDVESSLEDLGKTAGKDI